MRVGRLARSGHHVEGMLVGGALVKAHLGVEGLLADPLRSPTAAGRTAQQADGGVVELRGGDDVVDEAPVERGAGVDRVPGQTELQRPLLGHIARHGHQRRVAEPSALAAGRGEAGVLGSHRQVRGRDELAAGGGRQAVHARHDGLGDGLHREHELGARFEQLADRLGVGARQVPEVVAGGEDRTIGGQDHAPSVALARSAEGRRHVAQQPERQRVAALRAVHRDRREALLGLHEHGVGAHGTPSNEFEGIGFTKP